MNLNQFDDEFYRKAYEIAHSYSFQLKDEASDKRKKTAKSRKANKDKRVVKKRRTGVPTEIPKEHKDIIPITFDDGEAVKLGDIAYLPGMPGITVLEMRFTHSASYISGPETHGEWAEVKDHAFHSYVDTQDSISSDMLLEPGEYCRKFCIETSDRRAATMYRTMMEHIVKRQKNLFLSDEPIGTSASDESRPCSDSAKEELIGGE